MTRLRFGIVGCGAISEALYLPVLSKSKSICSELHLLDTHPGRLAAMAEKYRAASRTTKLPELIARVDAAVIATPPLTHFPIAQALIAAGKHVFCEKPMTIRLTEAEDLVQRRFDGERRAEIITAVAFQLCPVSEKSSKAVSLVGH